MLIAKLHRYHSTGAMLRLQLSVQQHRKAFSTQPSIFAKQIELSFGMMPSRDADPCSDRQHALVACDAARFKQSTYL